MGQGSTFSFTARVQRALEGGCLARLVNPDSNTDHDAGAEGAIRHDARVASRRVLLVDDNQINLLVGRKMLEKLGCRVDVAECGGQAIAAYRRAAYGVILTDIQMPGMDGYEVARRMRNIQAEAAGGRTPAHVPIVAVTAHAMKGDRERCLDAGMDDYLSKPFSRRQLCAVLDTWLPKPTEPEGSASDGSRLDRGSPELVLDPATVDELRSLDDDGSSETLTEVLVLYLDESSQLLARIGHAVETRDSETMSTLAHTLKSMSGNVGAMRLSTHCEQLVQLARTDTTYGTLETLAAIRAEHALVRTAASEILADVARPQVPQSRPA